MLESLSVLFGGPRHQVTGILMCQNSVWNISIYSETVVHVSNGDLLRPASNTTPLKLPLMKLNFHAVKHPKAS